MKDWSITVTAMEITPSIEADYGSFKPNEEGNQYVKVSLSVTNNGKAADKFMPSVGIGDAVGTKLLFGDGYEFSSTILLGHSSDIHDAGINPLSTQEGIAAFPVPESVFNSTDALLVQFHSGDDIIKIKVR